MAKIILIVGPTGVGKTEVGVHLAQKFSGEIINADSRQVYKELNIGTSKPPEELFKKVPHHLFGVCSLDQRMDASQSQKKTDQIIIEIIQRKRVPFIVGGTGLYIKTLLFGLFKGPPANKKIRLELEERVEKEGLGKLHEELEKIDPLAARTIHPNDPTRIIRALEVYQVTGKPISAHQGEHQFEKARYDYLRIGIHIDRKKLIEKIDHRVDEMIQEGLEEEVGNLYKKWPDNLLLSHAIGYKEWFGYFEGKLDKEKVIEQIKINTHQFAKRQMTWFRKEKDIEWFEPNQTEKMEIVIREFL